MCMKEKLGLFVCFCGCTDNVIQPSAAYIFPFISIFNLSQSISFTCMRWLRCWVGFFFVFVYASFPDSELCLCHVVVILNSLFTGKCFAAIWSEAQWQFSAVYFVSMSPGDYWAVVCILTPHIGRLHCRYECQLMSHSSSSGGRDSEGFSFFITPQWDCFTFGSILVATCCNPPPSTYCQDVSGGTYINHIPASEFQTMARQIWHWLWQCESGRQSIKCRAGEQSLSLHSNGRWINSAILWPNCWWGFKHLCLTYETSETNWPLKFSSSREMKLNSKIEGSNQDDFK